MKRIEAESGGCLVVKVTSETLEASPEMSYLLSLAVLQARRALGGARVERCQDPFEQPRQLDLFEWVLLLGGEDVFVGEQSLRAMRRHLEAGAEVVVPTPISRFSGLADEPVYSLRDFERLEARCLGGEAPEPTGDPEELPVSLWRREAFEARVESGVAPGRPARSGVYHAFIDYYGELRADIEPWVPEGVQDVLEIGCGRGRTGQWLQETFGCRVTGIELHPAAAEEAAARLHRVHVGDVATIDPVGPFDFVVGLELFEHLTAPEELLLRMRQILRPGGRILLSVPNVGHHSVVGDLVAGRWDYVPIGLLCFTHYRFFTRRTLCDWLERLGFESYRLVPQRTPLPESASALLDLPGADAESLETKGFYVVVDVP